MLSGCMYTHSSSAQQFSTVPQRVFCSKQKKELPLSVTRQPTTNLEWINPTLSSSPLSSSTFSWYPMLTCKQARARRTFGGVNRREELRTHISDIDNAKPTKILRTGVPRPLQHAIPHTQTSTRDNLHLRVHDSASLFLDRLHHLRVTMTQVRNADAGGKVE